MSYLARLAARARGEGPELAPRRLSRFDPAAGPWVAEGRLEGAEAGSPVGDGPSAVAPGWTAERQLASPADQPGATNERRELQRPSSAPAVTLPSLPTAASVSAPPVQSLPIRPVDLAVDVAHPAHATQEPARERLAPRAPAATRMDPNPRAGPAVEAEERPARRPAASSVDDQAPGSDHPRLQRPGPIRAVTAADVTTDFTVAAQPVRSGLRSAASTVSALALPAASVPRAYPRPLAAELAREPRAERGASDGPPIVHVTIEKVEVEAVPRPGPPPRPTPASGPRLALGDYLAARGRRR